MCERSKFQSSARYTFYLQTHVCCNCSIYHLLYRQHLLPVAGAGLFITFLSLVKKAFMQCYTIALHKRLVSAPVHAGILQRNAI